jgi:hypothetical protein
MNISGCWRKYEYSEVVPAFAAPTIKKFGHTSARKTPDLFFIKNVTLPNSL